MLGVAAGLGNIERKIKDSYTYDAARSSLRLSRNKALPLETNRAPHLQVDCLVRYSALVLSFVVAACRG